MLEVRLEDLGGEFPTPCLQGVQTGVSEREVAEAEFKGRLHEEAKELILY